MEKELKGISIDKVYMRADPTPEPARQIVRVKVPARIANNLASMEKITATVLNELGHPECHSNFDIRFDIISQYTVNKELDVIAIE